MGRMSESPGGAVDPYSQMPLFREIQRVLNSSSGPVNWELARQMGIAIAVMGAEEPVPTESDRAGLEDAARVAELRVAEFTSLSPPPELPHVRAVSRSHWIEASAAGLRAFVEPSAARVLEAFERMGMEAAGGGEEPSPAAEDTPANPFAAGGLEQLTPLLLGAQVGSVLGYLAQHVLGRYDIAIPQADPSELHFVVPNIVKLASEWSLSSVEFRQWVAFHEVVHRFEFARPWARKHFLELLADFASTLEFDLSSFRAMVEGLDMANPSAMQEMLGSEEALFGAVLDDEQRLKLARIQAFMAAAEGYGDHVTHALGEKLLPSYGQIEEAMRRYRETETGDPVFERLLGIEMKRDHYWAGRAFCDRVASEAGEGLLARMWDSPEALPSMPELPEPTLWMARAG